MRRAWLTGTMVLAAAGLLAGCTPPHLDLVAAYNGDDGKPWIMLAPCGKDDIESVWVSGWSTGDPTGPQEDSGWASRRFEPGIGGESLPLFEPPASWDANLRGAQKLLPGYTYSVSFFARDGSVYYGKSYVTAEDLAGLKPGEVWSGSRAKTRKEFREYVKDEC
ncbi:hypothetical protein [Streptomyces sp. NBC_01565]|uniref:hypothetical protein n=1 Tax=unclassified Streptomyces TaxID=2593676 RepID=UPI0022560098|nr:hypothetical protein [Streptomyces sp. NBC_01565]MCX4541094.1 hypothetical protein [Streptomyces sp. NBC_01565]